MRKFFFYLAAASAILAGCTKTELDVETPVIPIDAPNTSFVGTFSINGVSKTTITPGEENYSVYWEENDQIKISCDEGKNYYDFKIESISLGSAVAIFKPVTPSEIPAAFFDQPGYKATFGDATKTSFTQTADDDVKHLPMTATAGADRKLAFTLAKPVLAVKIPASVSAKSISVAVRGGSEVGSVSCDNALNAFYIPVPETTAQYNISAYSDASFNDEIAESMKMQVSAAMTTGNIYPFTFTPTREITAAGTQKLLSYPADYKVHILSVIADKVTITYVDGEAQHPANVYVNANENAVASLDINTVDSHVEIEKGNSTNVTSKTSKNSFVVKPTYYINTIDLQAGSVVVECKQGSDETKVQRNVEKITIPAESTNLGISINDINEGAPVRIENSAPTKEVSVVGVEDSEYDYKHNYEQEGQHPVTEVDAVAVIGDVRYATLDGAFVSAKSGETVKLLTDVELSAQVGLADKSITFDLDGKKVSAASSYTGSLFGIHNGAELIVDGNGEISTFANNTVNAITLTKTGDNPNVTASIVVNSGLIKGYWYAIAGNGSRQNTSIVVNGGTLYAVAGCAIYNPQNGVIVVNGGTIEGTEGIYMKSGSAVVATGGTIHGFGPKGSYIYYPSGSEGTGDAVVVENCNYPGGRPSLTVGGATLISDNAYQIGAYYHTPETDISDIYSTSNTLTVPDGYEWKETDVAGTYKLGKTTAVAKIGEKTYLSLGAALNAAKEGEAVYIIPDQLEETVSASNNNNIQLIMDGKALIGDLTFGGSGTLIVRAEELNVNYYHCSNYSSEDDPTIPAKGAGGIMGKISTAKDATSIVMLRENLYSGPFEGNVELRGGFYNAELGLQTIKDQTPGGIGLVVEQTQQAFGYTLYYVPEVPESYLVHVPAEFLAAAIAGQLTYEQISYATLGYGLGDRIMNPWWWAYGDGVGAPTEKHFPDDVYAFFTNLKDGNDDNPKYAYQNWYCDFEISYSEPIATDYQSGIWGYYSNMCFGCWLPSSVTENPFGMMKDGLGGRWEYSRMLSQVGMFLCGPKNLNSDDAGKVITVNLKIYPDEESPEYITTNKVVYTIPSISQ